MDTPSPPFKLAIIMAVIILFLLGIITFIPVEKESIPSVGCLDPHNLQMVKLEVREGQPLFNYGNPVRGIRINVSTNNSAISYSGLTDENGIVVTEMCPYQQYLIRTGEVETKLFPVFSKYTIWISNSPVVITPPENIANPQISCTESGTFVFLPKYRMNKNLSFVVHYDDGWRLYAGNGTDPGKVVYTVSPGCASDY